MLERERSNRVVNEVAVVARVVHSGARPDGDPLEEIGGLARTAGTTVADGLVQYRERPDPGTLMGRGKVQELKLLVEQHDADVVVFDNDLSPAQTRNL